MAYKLIGAQLAFDLADAMESYLQDLAGKAIWQHPVINLARGVPVTILPTIWGDISFEKFINMEDHSMAVLMNGTGPKRSYASYVILADPDMLAKDPELKSAFQSLGEIKMEKSRKRGVYSVFPQTSIVAGVGDVLGYTQKPQLQLRDTLQTMLLPGALSDLKACMDPTRAGYPAFPQEIKTYMTTPNKVGALPITQVSVTQKGREALLLRVTVDHLRSEFFMCPLIPLRYEQAPDLALLIRCILKYSSLSQFIEELSKVDPTLTDSVIGWIGSAATGLSGVPEMIKHLPETFLKKSMPMIERMLKMKGLADTYGWSAAHLLARETQLVIDTSSTLTGLFYDPSAFIGGDNILSRVKRTKYSVS